MGVRMAEVLQHKEGHGGVWTVIHNKVYDVSAFLAEHPGGAAILEENSGLDSTEQFEDAGHSLDAREMLADYYIGDLAEEDQAQVEGGTSEGITTNQILLASAVLLIASVIF